MEAVCVCGGKHGPTAVHWPHRFRRPWCSAIDEWISYPPLLPLDPTMRSKYCRTKSNLNLKTFFFSDRISFYISNFESVKGFLHEVGSNQNWITMRDTKGFDSNQKCLPFLLYILYKPTSFEREEKNSTHTKNVINTKRRNIPNRKFFIYFFCMCNSNYSLSHTLIKQSNQGSHYLVFSFHWLQITLTKLSKAMSGFDNIITR